VVGSLKVSALLITYNQAEFVAAAVESVLCQQVRHPWEVVIGDDCSTDNTPAVLRDLQQRSDGRVRLLLHDRRLGVYGNLSSALHACAGEYVAFLEGDDYWTTPDKLQKQVEFLDGHPECAFCFHNAVVVDQHGSARPELFCAPDQPEISSLEDLLAGNFVASCTVMLRRELVTELPPWFAELYMNDWPMLMLAAQHGNIGYLRDVMAAYRVHSRGLWSALDRLRRAEETARLYEVVGSRLDRRYGPTVAGLLAETYLTLCAEYARAGDLPRARRWFKPAVMMRQRSNRRPARWLHTGLLLYSPRIHSLLRHARTYVRGAS
jgi:glycosyltransferase involved in cell wall biosynthesis